MTKNWTDYDHIITLFRPADLWRQWPYIDAYLTAIDGWLTHRSLTEEQVIRYMLVGFYPYYRAANHRGDDLHTIPERWDITAQPYSLMQERVVTFNRMFGRPIRDTADYLAIITGTTEAAFDEFPHGLFAFVIAGYGVPFNGE